MPVASAMHAQPRRTLKRLIRQYGQDLITDPRRTEALLNDLCGQHRREIFVLVNAQKQRVPAELLAAPSWLPQQATWSRLSRQLQQQLAITEEAADWAVATWATALDLVPSAPQQRWYMPHTLFARRAQPTSPAARGQTRSEKRQSAAHGVQYPREAGRTSGRTARRSAEEARPVPPLRWGPPLPESLTKTATAVVVIVLAVALLALIVGEFVSPMGLATLATPVTTGEPMPDPAAALQDPAGSGLQPGAAPVAQSPKAPATYLAAAYPVPRLAWVAEGPLLVRPGPAPDGGYLATLEAKTGVTVDAISDDGRWSRITEPAAGWVSNDFLTFLSEDDARALVQLDIVQLQAPAPVEIRSAPADTAALVGTLVQRDGAVGVARTADGAWRQIAWPQPGWVRTDALTTLAPGP
jgi:hypothetical protein